MKGALISLQPRFARAILEGVKTTELRRRAPNCEVGDLIVLYESSPTMAIVGVAKVDFIERASVYKVWQAVRDTARITHGEFRSYFDGCSQASAIYLTHVRALRNPILLGEARMLAPGFRPPQSWCYLENLPMPLLSRIHRLAKS
jgi:predicted transcriptional regulator